VLAGIATIRERLALTARALLRVAATVVRYRYAPEDVVGTRNRYLPVTVRGVATLAQRVVQR
jgi:hypothetical protein